MSRPAIAPRAGLLLAVAAAWGCAGPRAPSPEDLKEARILAEIQHKSLVRDPQFVQITADRVQLPPTSDSDSLPPEVPYHFFVTAVLPPEKGDGQRFPSAEELLASGRLRIELTGVTRFSVRLQGHAPTGEQRERDAAAGDIASSRSSNTLLVTVTSRDIVGPIGIAAWFPREYASFERARRGAIVISGQKSPGIPGGAGAGGDGSAAKERTEDLLRQANPYGATARIPVYSGDLHTSIIPVSETEVNAAFGSAFRRNYFVGRVYLRNQRGDGRTLLVNTTSIRARCLFYRSPRKGIAGAFEGSSTWDDFIRRTRVAARTGAATDNAAFADVRAQVLKRLGSLDASTPPQVVEAELVKLETSLPAMESGANLVRTVAYRYSESWAERWTRPGASREQIADEIAEILCQAPSLLSTPGRVGLFATNKTAAVSGDLFLEGELARIGHLWEDYYRPATLRSVLVSLMESHERNLPRRVFDAIEKLGFLAGGLVGRSGIAGEFGRPGYAEWTSAITNLLIPSAKDLLFRNLEDILKNVGTLGLDTIVEIPPNGVVDGYVFFPRGPLYAYAVSGLDVNDPAYIVDIDNGDVSIDGVLVEQSSSVSGGTAESSPGVTRSLQGSTREALEARVSDLQAKARRAAQALLGERIRTARDDQAKRAALDAYSLEHGTPPSDLVAEAMPSTPPVRFASVTSDAELREAEATVTWRLVAGEWGQEEWATRARVKFARRPAEPVALLPRVAFESARWLLNGKEVGEASKSSALPLHIDPAKWDEPRLLEFRVSAEKPGLIDESHAAVAVAVSSADEAFRGELRLVVREPVVAPYARRAMKGLAAGVQFQGVTYRVESMEATGDVLFLRLDTVPGAAARAAIKDQVVLLVGEPKFAARNVDATGP
jgi:hypothetical protein